MKVSSGARAKAIALLTGLQLAAGGLQAQSPEVERLFPERPTGYVTDVAGIVDQASAKRMEDLIARLRAATGAEIAVVTLPTIDDRDEAEVALAIGRKWGVGARAGVGDQRRNAGLVVLLVPRVNHEPGTGHLRIEVGRGLEGIVTDATAGRIRRDVMGPLLAEEKYGPALLSGVEALVGVIARGFGVSDTMLTNARPVASGGDGSGAVVGFLPFLMLLVFFLIISRAMAGRRGRRRVYWGGPWIGGGWGGGGGFGGSGFGGGGGFGGFGGGGGFSGGGAGGRF